MNLPSLILLLAATLLFRPSEAAGKEEVPDPPQTLPHRCGICHLDTLEPVPGGTFNFLSLGKKEAPGERDMCYSCHNGPVRDSRRSIWSGRQHRAGGRKVDMAPGREASCGTCHTPHVQDEGEGTFMRFRRETFTYCVECHPGRRGTKEGEHSSVDGGGKSRQTAPSNCGACHRVHRAAASGLIRDPSPTALCVRCHGDNPSRKEEGPGSSSHPIGGEGPSCSTCHTMHRAPAADLVRRGASDSTLCLECHRAHGGRSPGDGNHPTRPEKADCLSCHRLHNAASRGKAGGLLSARLEEMDGLCGACHSSQAAGEGEWNHPLGKTVEDTMESKLAKLARYGGLLGPERMVQCLTCHRAHGAVKGTSGLVVSRQALCLYCHRDQNSLAPATARFGTHPISVQPRRAVIAEALLREGGEAGPGGELICSTCHKVHHGREGTDGLVLSREEYACTLCHRDEAGAGGTAHGATDGEGDPCQGCHGHHGWEIDIEAVEMGGNVIDRLCWSCHGQGAATPMSGFFGHLIGIPSVRGTGGRDLPLFWSDGRRLEQGLISCATCHDIHGDKAEYLLRMKPDEQTSDLCLGCHRQQATVVGTKHDLSLFFPQEKNRLGQSASRTGPCGTCHVVHSAGPGESWAREARPEDGKTGELATFCSSCHREGALAQGHIVTERRHPFRERPERAFVDCNGCHDSHLWNPLNPSDKGDFFTPGGRDSSFLVSPAGPGSPLCRRCHPDNFTIAGSRHDFSATGEGEGLCESCHLPHGGQPLLMWPSPLAVENEYATGTCLSCHSRESFAPSSLGQGFNHPIGVSPGPNLAEELPLFTPSGQKHFRGKVACGTCHDPHRWSPPDSDPAAGEEEAGPATSFLRLPADSFSPLCFACHPDRSIVVGTDHDFRVTAPKSVNNDGRTAEESGVCGSCHRMHGSPYQLALWNRKLGKGEDPQSRYCRNCHDGGGEETGKVPPRLDNHLVAYPGKGMVERTFVPRQRSLIDMSSTFPLYSREGLQKKDRGFLSCASCHDVHSWEPDAASSGTGEPMEGDIKNSFLKVRNTFAVGRSFCKECHGDDALDLYRNYHFPGGQAPGSKDRGP